MNTAKASFQRLKKVLGTIIENLPNVQKMYEDLHEKFEVEKDCKNDAYFFILESGNFYKYSNGTSTKRKATCKAHLKSFGLTT